MSARPSSPTLQGEALVREPVFLIALAAIRC